MGYYIRILSPSDRRIPFAELRDALEAEFPAATLSLDEGSEAEWEQLLLRHPDGTEIAVVERNAVEQKSLGAEELQEFRGEIVGCKPHSAVVWLDDYFSRVRTIYAFQLFSGTEGPDGWEILGALKTAIWQRATGIFQADGEGFSNEDGYHILWQFSESVSGEWSMGVLKNGTWVHFQMDLGNPLHRQAFLQGEVPRGVKLA